MVRRLAHRGPDDEGIEDLDACVLGHRRLSIIDLSDRGHQPMALADGNLWISYNGEVYNYLELRRELEGLGAEFRTDTDTEVVLAAYDRWGVECLSRFNGMWAFALWDGRKRQLFCARDRFGEKPFFYWPQPEGIYFASEIKAFRELAAWPPPVDETVAHRYLVGGLTDQGDRTFLQGIHSLPAAHYMVLKPGGQPEARNYWEPPRLAASELTADVGQVEVLREALRESVRLRLRSDVAVGTCLSGGIDSSTILGLVGDLGNREGDERPHTFSACFQEERIDERPFMEAAISHNQAVAHRVSPTSDDLMRDLDDLIRTQDEPFASTSIYAQYRVFGLARESGVPVSLDGQGADELFAGYTTYHTEAVRDLIERGHLSAAFRESRALAQVGRRSTLSLLRRAWTRRPGSPGPRRPAWVSPDLAANAKDDVAVGPSHEPRSGPLQERLYRDLVFERLPSLLRYADRNSMRHGVESRLPFLDPDVVDVARSADSRLLIRDGWSKWLLRQAGAPYLPKVVVDRRDKIGYATPEAEWFRGSLGAVFVEILHEGAMDLARWCVPSRVSADWESFSQQGGAYRSRFWKLLNLVQWERSLHGE